MADYIKREDMHLVIEKDRNYGWYTSDGTEAFFKSEVYEMLKAIPSADVAEVVRCKDCIHRPIMGFNGVMPPLIDEEDCYRDYQCPYVCDDDYYNVMPDDNWFCNHGERMAGGT